MLIPINVSVAELDDFLDQILEWHRKFTVFPYAQIRFKPRHGRQRLCRDGISLHKI